MSIARLSTSRVHIVRRAGREFHRAQLGGRFKSEENRQSALCELSLAPDSLATLPHLHLLLAQAAAKCLPNSSNSLTQPSRRGWPRPPRRLPSLVPRVQCPRRLRRQQQLPRRRLQVRQQPRRRCHQLPRRCRHLLRRRLRLGCQLPSLSQLRPRSQPHRSRLGLRCLYARSSYWTRRLWASSGSCRRPASPARSSLRGFQGSGAQSFAQATGLVQNHDVAGESGVSASLRAFSGGIRGCYSIAPFSVSVSACALSDVDWVWASGQATGTATFLDADAGWVALGGGVVVAWRLSDLVSVRASVDSLAPPARPPFVAERPDGTFSGLVHRPSALIGRAGMGVEFHFF